MATNSKSPFCLGVTGFCPCCPSSPEKENKALIANVVIANVDQPKTKKSVYLSTRELKVARVMISQLVTKMWRGIGKGSVRKTRRLAVSGQCATLNSGDEQEMWQNPARGVQKYFC